MKSKISQDGEQGAVSVELTHLESAISGLGRIRQQSAARLSRELAYEVDRLAFKLTRFHDDVRNSIAFEAAQ